MTDTFNVTAAYDKASYNKGDTMTLTISGGDVLTTGGTTAPVSVSITITAADGATNVITASGSSVTSPGTATPQSVKMTSIADTSGRVWSIATSGLTATAVA